MEKPVLIPVPTLARFGLMVAMATGCASAEEVAVFRQVDAPISKLKRQGRKDDPRACKVGDKVGTLHTGKTGLAGLARTALTEDQSDDPFFGPGYRFILRDSTGQHFIVFLEYEKGHESFDALRAALAPLETVSRKAGVFAGDPYRGVTFDKDLLKQLKSIADKLPEGKKNEDASKEPE